MTINKTKFSAFDSIQKNIDNFGYHIYLVSASSTPRYGYTIGLSEKIGYELVLAGALFYNNKELKLIINEIADQLISNPNNINKNVTVPTIGKFTLKKAHSSWSNSLLLGAIDFYDENIRSLQIVPDKEYMTIDVPDLSKNKDMASEPVWQWLDKPWTESISKKSIAITNLKALKGEAITEAMRWEELEWELFAGAGPDVLESEMRKVPFCVLLGFDQSISPVMSLKVGKGLWRDSTILKWNKWN